MKWIVSLFLSSVGCGLGFFGLLLGSEMLGAPPHGTGDDTEPPRCVSEATIQLTASPSKITLGQSSVVSWSVNLPDRCPAVQVKLDGESVATRGSQSVSPARTTSYRLVVSQTRLGVHGEKAAVTRVEVAYPPQVIIDRNTRDPVGVLLGVLSNSMNAQQTIELCDVDLDLTGHSWLPIGNNRSLIASPACARGPRSLGPRIFVTDTHRGRAPLFDIQGDNVRVSGFRLEGPTSGIGSADDNTEQGIQISPLPSPEPIHSIEISNMEIFHWSGAGVQVRDNVEPAERGRLFNTNPGAVRIKNNYFHHNRHDSEGYGVESAAGAYATIEENVFDENRHAIAGGSKNCGGKRTDYSGYTARDNLILSGGGRACHVICWHTHQIDMHGDKNDWPHTGCGENDFCSQADHWYSKGCHQWNCGTAGETMIIVRNTILYTAGHAIKIRGNPADKAVVDGNVFKHGRSGAIAQNGGCGYGDNITNPIQVRPNNVFGIDPMTELGSCDFFGDGQQDQFMATGVTWWAKSPVTQQWRYLNTMPERISELKLVDIDGDGLCDVAPKTSRPEVLPEKYSKSGTSPWLPRVIQP
jgi:hypothetical protein